MNQSSCQRPEAERNNGTQITINLDKKVNPHNLLNMEEMEGTMTGEEVLPVDATCTCQATMVRVVESKNKIIIQQRVGGRCISNRVIDSAKSSNMTKGIVRYCPNDVL